MHSSPKKRDPDGNFHRGPFVFCAEAGGASGLMTIGLVTFRKSLSYNSKIRRQTASARVSRFATDPAFSMT